MVAVVVQQAIRQMVAMARHVSQTVLMVALAVIMEVAPVAVVSHRGRHQHQALLQAEAAPAGFIRMVPGARVQQVRW
jgi:hypothetical protein